MRLVNIVVMTVGVALSVAPIFSSLHAQQVSDQARALLEMQAIQQELGTLRDMVERQNFEMRKLKRTIDQLAQMSEQNRRAIAAMNAGSENGENSEGELPTPSDFSTPQEGASNIYQPTSDQGLATSEATTGSQSSNAWTVPGAATTTPQINPQIPAPVQQEVGSSGAPIPTSQSQGQSAYGSQTAPSSLSQPSVYQQPDAASAPDFYDPAYNPSAGQTQQDNAAATVYSARDYDSQASANAGQVGVSERVITAPPLESTANSRDFPPVVDRSLGDANRGVPAVVTGQGSATPNTAYPASRVPSGQSLPQTTVPATTAPRPVVTGTQGNPSIASTTIVREQPAPVSPTAASATTGVGTGVIAIPSSNVPSQVSNTVRQQVPAPQPTQAPGNSLSEDQFYDQGFELLKQSKFEEASKVFEQQIQAYPNGGLADDAHYWISEANTMLSNTDVARDNLRAIVDRFPQSSRVPDAKLRLAYIEERKGNVIEARILLQEIITGFPQSDAAIAAKNRLAALN